MLSTLRRWTTRPLARQSTGFWLYAGHLMTVSGLALSNAFMGLSILWAAYHRRSLLAPPAKPAAWRPVFVPMGLYVAFFCVSALTSLEPTISLPGLRDILSFATLLLAPMLVRGEAQVRQLYDLLIATMVLMSLHGIAQFYFTDYGGIHNRIIGPFSHYQTFAGVLLIGALMLGARLASAEGWRSWISWLSLGLVLWALLLTLTRGAWMAALTTLAVLTIARGKRVFLGTVTVVVLFFLVLAPTSWTERLMSSYDLEDASNYDRLCMVEAGYYMMRERPLFGIGPEVAEARYPIYRHPTAPRLTVPHLHNAFVQRAAEQGLVGLAAFLALLLVPLTLAVRELRRHGIGGPRAELYLAVVLVICGFMVAGLFEDNWRDTEVRRLLLFFLGVPLALNIRRSDDASTTSQLQPKS